MVKAAHRIIGLLLLTALFLSVVGVAYDYCCNSAPLYPRCSVCELKKVLNETFKKDIAATFLDTDSCWSGLIAVYSKELYHGDESPSVRRLVSSPRTDRAPPELS